MGDALALAFTAALNPTLLTATMVMLFAAHPRPLMTGYLAGAYTVSISLGLVIVFALQGSSAVTTTQHTLSPVGDIAIGVLLLLVAYVVHGDRAARVREYRKARAEARGPKKTPRWRKALDKGSARTAFVVGILLTLPGASYLAGMTRISKQDISTPETVASVVVFCVIMLALIEIPLLGFALRPDATRYRIRRFTEWLNGNTRVLVTRIALAMGGLLVLRGVIALLI